MADDRTMAIPRRWVSYLVKGVALLALLYVASLLVPRIPAWGVAIIWALLSLVLATGVVYHVVISKTFSQKKFRDGVAGFTVTRAFYFIGAFAVSALCAGSLIVESPNWGLPMWVAIALALPVYVGVSLLVKRLFKKFSSPLFLESATALASAPITGFLLLVAYAVLVGLQPDVSYTCAADAFLAAPKPFDSSPSALMSEVGEVTALVSGLTSYALARLTGPNYLGYVVVQALVEFGAFTGVAGMLAVCSIEPGELKRVFQRLGDPDRPDLARPVLKPYVALSLVLPLVLVAGFVHADAQASEALSAHGISKAQEFVKKQVNLIVYEWDGKYYDPALADELLEQAREKSDRLSAEAVAALEPLINESFDKRVANVDVYLDWYYRLFGDWEQLASVVTGSAEEFAAQKLEEHIEAGIDDSELNAKLEYYLAQAEDLQARTMEQLAEYELAGDYPDWLVTEVEPMDAALTTSLEPARQFLSANERIGISVVAGAIAGVIAKKVLGKLVTKSFFKAIATRVGGLLAASTIASAAGPVAVAVTVIASLAADIALQKADELLNRETYKEELVSSINEQREEMLEAVRSWGQVPE